MADSMVGWRVVAMVDEKVAEMVEKWAAWEWMMAASWVGEKAVTKAAKSVV